VDEVKASMSRKSRSTVMWASIYFFLPTPGNSFNPSLDTMASALVMIPVKPFGNLTLSGNRRDSKNLTLGYIVFSDVDRDGKVFRYCL
jgi:hypothetical protein